MPTALIGAAITGGSSLVSGLLGRKSAAQQSSNWNSTTKASSENNSTVRRDLLPEQEAALGPLFEAALGRIMNPGGRLEPIRAGMREGVNQRYAGADEILRKRLMRSGGNASGKMGTATRQLEMGRLGELGGVDSEIAKLILGEQDAGLSLAERLLGMNFGQSVQGTATSTQNQTGQSVVQGPAPGALAGGLSGGLDALSTILMMNKILQGGGGGGGQDWSGVWDNVDGGGR